LAPSFQFANANARILIVRTSAMGDILHALPAVATLRRMRPGCFIGWVVEPRWSALLETANDNPALAQPVVDVCHLAPIRDWKRRPFSTATLASIRALRKELRAQHYDLCVDLQGTIRSAAIGRMAGVREFAGPADPRELPARWLYRRRLARGAVHVVERGAELLGGALGEAIEPGLVSLPVNDADERWADGMAAAGRFALIAPTAGWGAKMWPAERYGEVARRLGEAGVRTLVNATPGTDATAARVVAESGGAAQAVSCTVAQLIALTRRAALVVAGDSGPLHLAAALERPLLGLYGPNDPARTGPWGAAARTLRHPASRTSLKRNKRPDPGLLLLSADEVAQAALNVLAGV
jgi:heptosyltransferase-1